jgi:predicted nuclease of predicted toxin-antitoxin system
LDGAGGVKLLFDQNLSHKLADALAGDFPGSAHVRDLGMARAGDPVVWSYAAANEFVIVSKDVDFQQRALLLGHPPKVVWIRLGNCVTSKVAVLLRSHRAALLAFEVDASAAFIALA